MKEAANIERPKHGGDTETPDFRNIPTDALRWVIDLAYDDQDTYLRTGSPRMDYGEEWPQVAAERAAWCEAIARAALIYGEEERWMSLAEDFRDSATELCECGRKKEQCTFGYSSDEKHADRDDS